MLAGFTVHIYNQAKSLFRTELHDGHVFTRGKDWGPVYCRGSKNYEKCVEMDGLTGLKGGAPEIPSLNCFYIY